MENKNLRIKTDISKDKVVNVKLDQDVDFLEVLSLKINQEDTYKLHSSSYGVVIGRVLANEAFGIPNAKVSVFIKLDDADKFNSEITNLYPYTSVLSNDSNGIRYNLLPDSSNDICHKIVGTFPNKRLVLDDDTVLEVFDKYWKYTTVTNRAGDYMIFGVPTGSQQIHVDIDLSDIGILSQKPRDMIYKGYNITQFENSNQFKESTNLDGLSQLYAQNDSVYVYPFWGDSNANEIAITRCDIQIQYKFEPTCVFMGSIITDNFNNNIGHNCSPSKWSGLNRELVTAEGTIETIRKTVDGLVEEFQIQGNRLINGDGVWCYQIPMNLDYVGTDEYGNIVPTDNPKKGIPTKTSVRFRVSVQETESDGVSRHRAKYLVPNNPQLVESSNQPKIENGKNFDNCYEFGSATPDEHFRDLYWNKVYSVKSYVPRIQNNAKASAQNYNALRTTNSSGNSNPIPFNKVRFRIVFGYRLLCMIMTVVIWIITIVNGIFSGLACICIKIFKWKVCPFRVLPLKCIPFSIGITEDEDENVEYFPGCAECGVMNCTINPCRKENSVKVLENTVQQALSQEYDIVNLDFANDWINGTLYAPLWYWRKTKKKKFLFGLFSKKAVNSYCGCNKNFPRLRVLFPCSLPYSNTDLSFDKGDGGKRDWHTRTNPNLYTISGIIKEVENKDGLKIYYYSPGVPTDFNYKNTSDPVSYIRLYSTDIILLGSLSSCDLDGLPQPFLNLPTTTANVPFIITVKQSAKEDGAPWLEGTNNEPGVVEVTGMDWLHDPTDDMPQYGEGLLFDLGCTNIKTIPKTCINVERMCELGVGLDILYQENIAKNGNLMNNNMKADGMITRYELLDNDTRSMFASLNHYGLQKKVFNKNTGYDSYKLHYIYPVDFDGRMSKFSTIYTNGMQFKTYDTKDMNYINYRMGPNGRHFYSSSGGFQFPLYNNSFYFYFGLKDGSTAIDKFNELFFSECYRNTKYPFLMSVEKTPAKWCINEGNYNSDYGVIQVTLDGIKIPYSYSLSDEFDTILVSENSMYNTLLAFGAKVKDGGGEYEYNADGTLKKDGRLQYFTNGVMVTPQKVLTNQTYKLTVTDNKGQSVTQIINVDQSPINMNYQAYSLGTKYFPSGETVINDICNDNAFYGNIVINSVIIDGGEYKIACDSINSLGNGKYKIKTINDKKEEYFVLLEMSSANNTTKFTDALCNNTTVIQSFECKNGSLYFNIWIPGDYSIRLTQYCNGVPNDNMSNFIVHVSNGELFELFLNAMPLRFLLGKNENVSLYNKNFYNSNVNVPTDLKGWFNLHKEDTYSFLPIEKKYISVWENYTGSLEKDETGSLTDNGKQDIIKYKLDTIFSLCTSAYVAELSDGVLRITHKGGKSPILYRGVYPKYSLIQGDEDVDSPVNTFVADSIGYTVCNTNYPNIVGFNYCKNEADGTNNKVNHAATAPYFNPLLINKDNAKKLGNYFAAFSQDGGIVYNNSESLPCKEDKTIRTQQIPNKANVLYRVNGEINCPNGDGIELTDIPDIVIKKNNTNNPYLRAEFVDRRFDYDFFILTPYSGNDVRISDDGGGDTGLWKNGRFSGNTINGVEMAYNKSYNIISKNKNDGLEYFYDLKNVSLTYNTVDKALNSKKLYRITIKSGGKTTDLRNFSWSLNRNPITHPTEKVNTDASKGVYCIDHSSDTSLYNGDFDERNYPMRRLFDVGNIPNGEKFTFSGSSCSYKAEITQNEDGTLDGIVESDGEVTFDIDCRNMINTATSSLESNVSKRMFNILYVSIGTGELTFTSKVFKADFTVKNDTFNDTHLCQTKVPKYVVIKNSGDTNNLIDKVKKMGKISDIENEINKNSFQAKANFGDEEINIGDDGFFYDSEWGRLFDDSSEFKKISFSLNRDKVQISNIENWGGYWRRIIGNVKYFLGADLSNVDIFSMLIDRKYYNSNADNLSKNIRAIEFGSLYDCRPFKFKGKVYEDVVETITVPPDPEISGDTGSTEYVKAQFFEFTMTFGDKQLTDAFSKKDNTQFSIVFRLKNSDVYISDEVDVQYDDSDEINPKFVKLITKWNGAFAEKFVDGKTAPIVTQIFIRTSNGLIYAFGFQINADKSISSI